MFLKQKENTDTHTKNREGTHAGIKNTKARSITVKHQ